MKQVLFLAYQNIIRDIKQVKVLFLTIVLCTILSFTFVVSMTSFIKYREELNNSSTNKYDVAILDVTYNSFSRVNNYESDEDISSLNIFRNLGYSKIESNFLNNKKYLFLQGIRQEDIEKNNFILSEGRLPRGENEIIIPKEYSQIYGISIGDISNLELGSIMNGNLPIQKTVSRLSYKESSYPVTFEVSQTKSYKVVGIYESSELTYNDNPSLEFYNIYTINNSSFQDNDVIDVLLTFKTKDDEKYKTYASNIGATTTSGIADIATFNSKNIEFSKTLKMVTYGVTTAIVLALIAFALAEAIEYGSHSRRKYYRQIMSLGASSTDIKNAWDLQTLITLVISIPVGICIGLITLHLSMNYSLGMKNINELLTQTLTSNIIAITALFIMLITLIINKVTEQRSLYLNPLDGLKGSQESIRTKYVHYNNITKLKGEIDKYIKSNKEVKVNKTPEIFIFLLTLSISSLMLFLSFNNVATKPIIDYLAKTSSTFTLRISENNKELLNSIKSLDQVEDYTIYRNAKTIGYIEIDSTSFEENVEFLKASDNSKFRLPIEIFSVNDEKFNPIGGQSQKYVLLNNINISSSKTLSLKNISEGSNSNLEVKGKDNENILSLPEYYLSNVSSSFEHKNGYISLLVKDENLNELVNEEIPYNEIILKVNNAEEFITTLDELISSKYSGVTYKIYNEKRDVLSSSNYIYISYISVYILIVVIALLLIISNNCHVKYYCETREKELGLLKSMGINSKDVKDIIEKEFGRSYYLSMMLGLLLGGLINIGLNIYFELENIEYLNSSMNAVSSTIVLLLFLMILLKILVSTNTKKIRKSYPIELINDNFKEF